MFPAVAASNSAKWVIVPQFPVAWLKVMFPALSSEPFVATFQSEADVCTRSYPLPLGSANPEPESVGSAVESPTYIVGGV